MIRRRRQTRADLQQQLRMSWQSYKGHMQKIPRGDAICRETWPRDEKGKTENRGTWPNDEGWIQAPDPVLVHVSGWLEDKLVHLNGKGVLLEVKNR